MMFPDNKKSDLKKMCKIILFKPNGQLWSIDSTYAFINFIYQRSFLLLRVY